VVAATCFGYVKCPFSCCNYQNVNVPVALHVIIKS